LAIDWSYVAGFLDGEGCVELKVAKRGKDKRYYYPRISLVQNRRWVLEKIQKFCGFGRLYTKKDGMSQLVFDNKMAVRFAKETLPYSLLKRPQLRAMLAAGEFSTQNRRGFAQLLKTLKRDPGADWRPKHLQKLKKVPGGEELPSPPRT
jgi:hypothetical protein